MLELWSWALFWWLWCVLWLWVIVPVSGLTCLVVFVVLLLLLFFFLQAEDGMRA